jgi:hypothetical protein
MRTGLILVWSGLAAMALSWGALVWIGGTPYLDRAEGYKVGFKRYQNRPVSRERWLTSWAAISVFMGSFGVLAFGCLIEYRNKSEPEESETVVIESSEDNPGA